MHNWQGSKSVIASCPHLARYRTRTMFINTVTASEAWQSMQSGSHGLLHFVRNDDHFRHETLFMDEMVFDLRPVHESCSVRTASAKISINPTGKS